MQIAPSILSADFARLGAEVRAVTEAGADQIHIDIMDGHFVPNLTLGPDIVRSIRSYTSLPFDVHLMVTNPDVYLEAFARAGADSLTVHVEVPGVKDHLDRIRRLGKEVGISLNPLTDISEIQPYVTEVDRVLVMTVQPGFGGQSFREDQLEKIRLVRAMIDARGLKTRIAVDGGINAENAPRVVAMGADILIAGSSVFKGGDREYTLNINALRFQKNP